MKPFTNLLLGSARFNVCESIPPLLQKLNFLHSHCSLLQYPFCPTVSTEAHLGQRELKRSQVHYKVLSTDETVKVSVC